MELMNKVSGFETYGTIHPSIERVSGELELGDMCIAGSSSVLLVRGWGFGRGDIYRMEQK